MGTCCFGNSPPEKFVGVWTDSNKQVELTINDDGRIIYGKETEHTHTHFVGPTRYKDNELFYCFCCCLLRGKYVEEDDVPPKLIANGTELTRKEP